jgi:hypothetical protein
MTIEEIKKIFTAGTVFVPAHITKKYNTDPDFYVTIHELDTFEYVKDTITLIPHDKRKTKTTPTVYLNTTNGILAHIISKPEKNISQTNILPNKWLFLATNENLELINQFRRYKRFPDFDINKYNYINYNGYGLKTIPFPGDNILNQNQFEEYCKNLGIDVEKDKTLQVIDNSSVKFKAKALNPWTAARTISGRMCNDTGFDALDGFNVLNEMTTNIDPKRIIKIPLDALKAMSESEIDSPSAITPKVKKVKQIELIPIKKRRII